LNIIKTLIRIERRCLQVKEEDVDWCLYQLIPEAGPIPVCDLAAASGFDPAVVDTSLARLERYFLIERTGSSVMLMSFGEAFIRNQMQYEEDLPFVIEDGVIREKKKDHAR
ncbi:MAG: hypothetical protein LUQ19_00110, partial [Methanoregula sp.]|nr:hypothetical protein [Methanoregula sp.]